MCVCVYMNHFAVHGELTQHFKSTIPQLNTFKKLDPSTAVHSGQGSAMVQTGADDCRRRAREGGREGDWDRARTWAHRGRQAGEAWRRLAQGWMRSTWMRGKWLGVQVCVGKRLFINKDEWTQKSIVFGEGKCWGCMAHPECESLWDPGQKMATRKWPSAGRETRGPAWFPKCTEMWCKVSGEGEAVSSRTVLPRCFRSVQTVLLCV